MWPFRPRQPDITLLPPLSADNCTWGVAESGLDASPLIIRYNESARDWNGHKDLPIKLGFAIPLNSPNENGLPDPEENEQLDEIEDIIVREVGSNARGLYALALTNGQMKEFVFYVSPGIDIKALHKSIQALVGSHDVQCMAAMESDWRSYVAFTPA
jgi:hypothetical protein